MNSPNILYLHSHDTGRYIQPYGYAIPTPNLQRLAEEGICFRQAFTVSPTCSPSRAALLTGQYPHECGMWGLSHACEIEKGLAVHFSLNDYSKHLIHTLRQAGYFTALSGIQHIDGPFFDLSRYASRIGYDAVLTRDDKRHIWDHRRVCERAVEFLREPPRQPWFLSVGFHETHTEFGEPRSGTAEDPRYCRPPDPIPDTPETRRDMAAFKASARALDQQIGSILDALRRSGAETNTLVIATTDHGIPFPRMKCNLTDAGTGVFLIIKGAAPFSGGRALDPMVTHLDLFPTICDYLQIAAPSWLRGKSLLPLLSGEVDRLHEELFSEVNFHEKYEPERAVRTERWKYIRHYSDEAQSCDKTETRNLYRDRGWERHAPQEQLFDLFFVPHEANNLAGTSAVAAIQQDLQVRLQQWMSATGDPLLRGSLLDQLQPSQLRS